MRRGGNLAVCPSAHSVKRLIRAYLVCEVVYDSQRETWLKEQAHLAKAEFCLGEGKAALMGVELGEATPAEQRELEKLISDFRWRGVDLGGTRACFSSRRQNGVICSIADWLL